MDINNQLIIFNTKEQLIFAAQEQADKVDKEYSKSTYLYFVARYFVAIFECRYGEIPVQVWNEYRNALDHFFRYLTNNKNIDELSELEEKDNGHLRKMEGHLQRAVLDIIKIYCHRTKDSVIDIKSSFTPDVLQLVDNGRFYSSLVVETERAEAVFEEAKIYDSRLGESSRVDDEVLGKYLEAIFIFDELKIKIINKVPDIELANNQYRAIQDRASKGSTWHHYFIHFTFYIFWTAFGAACTIMWDSHIKVMYEGIVSFIFQ